MWEVVVMYLKNFWNFLFNSSPRWKDINGYENIYQISNEGDIYNVKDFKPMSTFIKKDGYECVALTDKRGKTKQYRVHRLVAQTFLQVPQDKKRVEHIDGDKTNNNVNNLRWV